MRRDDCVLEREFARRLVRLYSAEDYPVLEKYGDWEKKAKPPSRERVREILTADLLKGIFSPEETTAREALTNAAIKAVDRKELRELVYEMLAKKSDRLHKTLADEWEENRTGVGIEELSIGEAMQQWGKDDD